MLDESAPWSPPPARSSLSFGPLIVDPAGFSVSVDGRDVPLTYLEFVLFEALVRHPFQILRHEQPFDVVWGISPRRRKAESLGALTKHLGRLRAKLAHAGCSCIKTVYGVGYGFVPPPASMPTRNPSRYQVGPAAQRTEAG